VSSSTARGNSPDSRNACPRKQCAIEIGVESSRFLKFNLRFAGLLAEKQCVPQKRVALAGPEPFAALRGPYPPLDGTVGGGIVDDNRGETEGAEGASLPTIALH
jgi:hypothetical protein